MRQFILDKYFSIFYLSKIWNKLKEDEIKFEYKNSFFNFHSIPAWEVQFYFLLIVFVELEVLYIQILFRLDDHKSFFWLFDANFF
jgi:hypothetical protein